METKILRWTSGVTRFDHIRNKDRYGVAPIVEIAREIGLNIKVDSKRPKGQPKQRWLDTPNDETDHDEPTPFVKGTKAEEKEEETEPPNQRETQKIGKEVYQPNKSTQRIQLK